MVAKPRVHEIASEVGVDVKTAMIALKSMGEYVKGPSSSLEPPVAKRLRAVLEGRESATTGKVRVSDLAAELGVDSRQILTALREMRQHWGQNESSYLSPYLVKRLRDSLPRTSRTPVGVPPDVINLAGSRESAAVLARRLPQDLPALASLLNEHLDRGSLAQRTLSEAIESRNCFYAPSAAAAVIESRAARDEALTAESLLAQTGIAVICGEPADQYPPRWLIAWRATASDVTVVQTQFRFYESASPQPVTLLGFEPLEVERLPYGVRCGHRSHASVGRLMRLAKAIPVIERGEVGRHEPDEHAALTVADPGEETGREARSGRTRLVYLRRTRGAPPRSGGEGSTREHQWFVRGHWREQWYPSLNDHKRIWIDSHLAGRADAPIDGSPRVYVIRPVG